MYKRQDWLHLHGQNAAEASSSDSEAEETGAYKKPSHQSETILPTQKNVDFTEQAAA